MARRPEPAPDADLTPADDDGLEEISEALAGLDRFFAELLDPGSNFAAFG